MDRALDRAGIPARDAAARAMYAGLGHGIFELLWLAGASPARREAVLAERVALDTAALGAAVDAGPVVLCASHTGNWELAAAAAARWLGARGRRLAVVAKRQSVRGVDAFCNRLRARLGVDVIHPDGALEAARRALADGACVAMPIDQVPDRARHGLSVEFLGERALVDRAPAVLARRAKATLLVVSAERLASGRHRVEVLDTIAAPASAADVRDAVRRGTSALACFVRRSPASWLWLHRRWRAPRDRVSGRALAWR